MFSVRIQRRKSIKFRLVVDIGMIFLVMSIFNYFLVKTICQQILKEQEHKKIEIVSNAAVQQAYLINQDAHSLLSNINEILNIEDEGHVTKLKLEQIKVFVSKFKDVILLDMHGKGIGIYQEKYDLSDTPLIKKVLNEENISFNILEHKGEPYIVFGQVIKDISGEVQGILLGVQVVELFFNQITQVSGGEVCFVGNSAGDGFVAVGRNGSAEGIKGLNKDQSIQSLFDKGIIEGEDYVLDNRLNNCSLKGNYGKIYGTDWLLGVIRCTNEIDTALKDINVAMIVGMIVSSIIVIITIYFIASSIVKRIINISDYIEGNIESEFKEPIPKELLKDEDEIGQLVRELKRLREVLKEMLVTVKGSVDYLNDKINLISKENKEDQ